MPIYDNIESELLREQLLATSAESPAEAFVKRLLNPSPASRSKFEELLRAATAEASLAATATQAKESALENEDLREQLAASESRAAAAEASLAESTTQAKESALENEDLREQLAAAESSSSFKVPTAKGAVQHLRLRGEIDAASKVDAKGVAHRRRLSLVTIFGESYDPATTRSLRVPPASPTPGAARDRPSASQVPQRQRDHWHDPARDRPAHEADAPASSPRVPDARRAARPTFDVAGGSTATRSPARSRPRSAISRR
jgi:hypothetical protein